MTTTCDIERSSKATQPVERMRPRRTYVAPVDIFEVADELTLLVDLPGARADSIDVNYELGTLSIHATVEPRQNEQTTQYLLREYGVGDFDRSFQVGEGIDAAHIRADYKDGVLTVHLPKAEAVKPRKITVSGT